MKQLITRQSSRRKYKQANSSDSHAAATKHNTTQHNTEARQRINEEDAKKTKKKYEQPGAHRGTLDILKRTVMRDAERLRQVDGEDEEEEVRHVGIFLAQRAEPIPG